MKQNCITILGSGTSTGVPIINCRCSVCTSLDHRDQRLRTSIYIETENGKKILVDTSPDLRTQALRYNISVIDFGIITHDHADHLHGIDDLRPYSFTTPPTTIPLYTNAHTKISIQERFAYIFPKPDKKFLGGGIPKLTVDEVILDQEQIIQGESLYFFNYPHGHATTMGFRLGKFAYVVDCQELPDHLIKELKAANLDLLIIDCLQRHNQGTHLSVERSFSYIEEINAKQTGLIHISHDLSHGELTKMAHEKFGEKVFATYDGLKIHY